MVWAFGSIYLATDFHCLAFHCICILYTCTAILVNHSSYIGFRSRSQEVYFLSFVSGYYQEYIIESEGEFPLYITQPSLSIIILLNADNTPRGARTV